MPTGKPLPPPTAKTNGRSNLAGGATRDGSTVTAPESEVACRSARQSRRPIRKGVVRYFRHDSGVSAWEVKLDSPGRLKLKNPVLYRKAELCQAIERELMSVLGVDKYKTSSLTCTVVIDYDPRELTKGTR